MHLATLHHLTVNFLGHEVFRDLTWAIEERARVGLVGPNGAGKSSLLRAIAGELIPESGQVVRARGLRIGYLPQDISLPPQQTLLEAASQPAAEITALDGELARLDAQLGEPAVYGDEGALQRVLDAQAALLERRERLAGGAFASRARELLVHLGFATQQFAEPCAHLSGGQKKLIALVRLLASAPQLLLLDEPDNHLDLVAKQRLERVLAAYQGAVILVSHDRYLLDEIVSEIAELAAGKLTIYLGNYSAYQIERERARLRQERAYVTQQKQIAGIEAAIARFEQWASMVVDERHIRQARSRRKMLERMEERGEIIEKVREARQMGLQLAGSRGSELALQLRELTMAFPGEAPLFQGLDFTLRHGERIGLIGPNGAGKSLLFRLILGQERPTAGQIKIGPSSQPGHYAQEHQTLSDWLERTPLELVRHTRPMNEGAAVTFLLKFRFRYEQTRETIGHFSGGERSRLQLALLMLQQPNLLLLDEPTNNLDIPSAEALEAALEDFEGALLVISHDRYFLDRVVDGVAELRDGRLTEFNGGYTDYLAAVQAGRRPVATGSWT
ncbi:MAG: ABC-F family ATP-binding cassette domain-containing protein [Chloroflexi bacterium]|nr:ABC-F family ATP-binding cassette domain-containing protein [Chloroflexota bacterium]